MSSETGSSTQSSKPAPGRGIGILYNRYTTTSALANVDVNQTLDWTKAYMKDNFSAFLPRDKSARILEIGCGYGRNLLALQALGYTNTQGIDLSGEQVSYAQHTLGLGQVQQADALEWLQQAEPGFACILLIDVLEHLDLDTLMALGDLTHVRAFTSQSLQQFFSSVGLDMIASDSALPARRGVGLLRRWLWRLVFNPGFSLLFFLLHGRATFTTVFTANILAVGHKPAKAELDQ